MFITQKKLLRKITTLVFMFMMQFVWTLSNLLLLLCKLLFAYALKSQYVQSKQSKTNFFLHNSYGRRSRKLSRGTRKYLRQQNIRPWGNCHHKTVLRVPITTTTRTLSGKEATKTVWNIRTKRLTLRTNVLRRTQKNRPKVRRPIYWTKDSKLPKY